MREKSKQELIEALTLCGFTQEEAEENVFDAGGLDDGIGKALMKEMLGEEAEELVVTGLCAGEHEFEMNITRVGEDEYDMLLTFYGRPAVSGASAAFARYEETGMADTLRIENEIERAEDSLVLACTVKNNLKDGMLFVLWLLEQEACMQLLDTVLIEEEE